MKVLLIINLLCISVFAFAQDAKKDFQKINEVYNNTESFAMDITYELFLDGSTVPYQTEKGRYVKQGKKYYTLQAESEVIITDEYLFVIDRAAKVLAVDKKIDDRQMIDPLSQSLDSLFSLYSKVELLTVTKNNIKGYRFFIKRGPYASCDVYFDVNSNVVTEIKNVFRDKIEDENGKMRSAVLKTVFFNYTTKSVSFADVFNNNKYIKKEKQKYSKAENYRLYKFINHLN